MKELTRIITVEITEIKKTDDDMSDVITKEEAAKGTIDMLKSNFDCDDVVVTNVQDFILDK